MAWNISISARLKMTPVATLQSRNPSTSITIAAESPITRRAFGLWLLAVSSIPSRGSVPKFEDEHHCLVYDDRAPHVPRNSSEHHSRTHLSDSIVPIHPISQALKEEQREFEKSYHPKQHQ